jgi:NTP pyrophosphatase (non-canonical NTP hydrolase)
MSNNWVKDINKMHKKYGVHDWIKKNPGSYRDYLSFRIRFIQEELDELKQAELHRDNEEVVDALIDICVVAIGTLDAFGVDAYEAWDEVFKANMNKFVGAKKERPNPLGLPDLAKPDDWVPPSHIGNHGKLPK